MLRDSHPLLRWTLAGVLAGAISTVACWLFGMLLPVWIIGPDNPGSPTSGEVYSVTLSFASAYSLLAFILLTLSFHRRFSGLPPKDGAGQLL